MEVLPFDPKSSLTVNTAKLERLNEKLSHVNKFRGNSAFEIAVQIESYRSTNEMTETGIFRIVFVQFGDGNDIFNLLWMIAN